MMGTVYKPTFTKPLPSNGELFTTKGETFARVKPLKGRAVTYPVTTGEDGSQRILVETGTYVAKYRDGSGLVHTVSTGCRDEGAARSVLGELERRAELVKAGVMTAGEDRIGEHAATPIAEHFASYLEYLTAKGTTQDHRANTRSYLGRLAFDCGFLRISELDRSEFEKWLAGQIEHGMSARSRNAYRVAMVAFCNWCVAVGRMSRNPFAGLPKADEKCDQRRQRRAMTEDELRRLLHVARWRPLAEFGRESVPKAADEVRSKRSTWTAKPLTFDDAVESARERLANNPDFVAKLELRGRERQLIFKTLVTTGLRKGELASVKLRHLDLDAERAFLTLDAKDEKNRQGNSIPLRADLADDLRSWLADRLTTQRKAAQNAPTLKFERKAGRNGRGSQNDAEGSGRLSPDEPLFTVPTGLVKILDRDLEAAGIPKRDNRDRTLDVHALQTTFGTHLSKAGVSLRTAQAAMRHSTLTANIDTDPRLLDVHGAVESLPTLSLTMTRKDAPEVMRATGTMGALDSQLAPLLAPTSGKPCLLMAYTGTQEEHFDQAAECSPETKNPENGCISASFSGSLESASSPDRTEDLLIKSQLLYRLS